MVTAQTMNMIDSHCHLDYLKKITTDELIPKAQELGITKIITISVNYENMSEVIQTASAFSNVYCTLGVHPHHADNNWDKAFELINHNIKDKSLVAIGEIGLDYHYMRSPKDIQKKIFEKQLEIAANHNLPVVIHSRNADDDTRDILKNFLSHLTNKCVLHSFTSGIPLFNFAMENNFYIGINGIITFKAAENVRDIVRRCPISKILLETDAPFLAPVPHRGEENSPLYLPLIAKEIAYLKDVSLDKIVESSYQNTVKLFNLKE